MSAVNNALGGGAKLSNSLGAKWLQTHTNSNKGDNRGNAKAKAPFNFTQFVVTNVPCNHLRSNKNLLLITVGLKMIPKGEGLFCSLTMVFLRCQH